MKSLRFLKKPFIAGMILALVIGSCEDWLGDTDYGHDVVSTSFTGSVTDLEKLLNGGYAALLGDNGEGIASAPFLINALNGDFARPFAPKYDQVPEKYKSLYLRRNNTSGNGSVGYEYIKYLTRAGNVANMVIDALENGSLEDDPWFNDYQERLRGESYLLRALANFEITKLVGKQYNASSSSGDQAGYYPLKPVYTIDDLPASRKTVQESYQQLISDCEEAIGLLPVEYQLDVHPTYYATRRFTRDVGFALLAKVYFQMNDFSKAKVAVDSVLGPGLGEQDGLMKYPLSDSRDLSKKVYWGKEDAPYGPSRGYEEEDDAEIICDFYGTSDVSGPNLDRNAWGWIFTPDPLYSDMGRSKISEELAAGYFTMSESFMDYVDFDRDDKRGEDFLDEIEGPGFDDEEIDYYWPLKYQVERINVLWYRSAEFYLMRAECNARLGYEPDALADLNYIRDRADLDEYEGSDDEEVDEDLVAGIIKERAREMFQDNYRYFELLRLGAFDGSKLPAGDRREEDIVVGDASGVNYDDPALLFPLPANE